MAISSVRPYFRARMKALNFKEHKDGFNFNNVPSTLQDKTFHIDSGDLTIGSANQLTHEIDYKVTVRVYKRGFRDPNAALDAVDQTTETILTEILKPSNRLGTDIKDVVPDAIRKVPLDNSNDNAIILEMDFTAKLEELFS